MKAKVHTLEEQYYCTASDDIQEGTQIQGGLAERRKNGRLNHHFSARFCKVGVYFPVEGVTKNVGLWSTYNYDDNMYGGLGTKMRWRFKTPWC